jgi:hypothetical protein
MNEFKKYVEKNRRPKADGNVAQHAKIGKPNRKQTQRLERRLAAWSLSMSTKNLHGGIQQRKDTGGFIRPGSHQ